MEEDHVSLVDGRLTISDRRCPRYSGRYWLTAKQETSLIRILEREPISSESRLCDVRDWIDKNGSGIIDFEPRS